MGGNFVLMISPALTQERARVAHNFQFWRALFWGVGVSYAGDLLRVNRFEGVRASFGSVALDALKVPGAEHAEAACVHLLTFESSTLIKLKATSDAAAVRWS